jgi:hypothetical protein
VFYCAFEAVKIVGLNSLALGGLMTTVCNADVAVPTGEQAHLKRAGRFVLVALTGRQLTR